MDSKIYIDALERLNTGELELVNLIDYLKEEYNLSQSKAEEYAFMAESEYIDTQD